MNRRQFGQLVFGGITFSIFSPEIIAKPLATPPAKSTLGLELSRPKLWLEGLHKVRIVGINIQPSRVRDGSNNIVFEYESLDGKSRIKQYFSDRAIVFLAAHLTKTCGMKLDNAIYVIELEELIGKEIEIMVKIKMYLDRQVNIVETPFTFTYPTNV